MAYLLARVQPPAPIPASLRDVRNALHRDAWDHRDLGEYLTGITEAAALVVRLRQIAAECERPEPLLRFAEAIEDAAYPLEREAQDWDDGRDGRVGGNALDRQRLIRGAA